SSAAVADTYSVGDSTTAVSSLQPRVTRSAVGLWHRYRLRSLECLLPELLGLCARRGPIATGRRSGCGWVLLQQPQRIDELSQHVGLGRDALDPLPRIGVGGSRDRRLDAGAALRGRQVREKHPSGLLERGP